MQVRHATLTLHAAKVLEMFLYSSRWLLQQSQEIYPLKVIHTLAVT